MQPKANHGLKRVPALTCFDAGQVDRSLVLGPEAFVWVTNLPKQILSCPSLPRNSQTTHLSATLYLMLGIAKSCTWRHGYRVKQPFIWEIVGCSTKNLGWVSSYCHYQHITNFYEGVGVVLSVQKPGPDRRPVGYVDANFWGVSRGFRPLPCLMDRWCTNSKHWQHWQLHRVS